jgi:hypothetical protein
MIDIGRLGAHDHPLIASGVSRYHEIACRTEILRSIITGE